MNVLFFAEETVQSTALLMKLMNLILKNQFSISHLEAETILTVIFMENQIQFLLISTITFKIFQL